MATSCHLDSGAGSTDDVGLIGIIGIIGVEHQGAGTDDATAGGGGDEREAPRAVPDAPARPGILLFAAGSGRPLQRTAGEQTPDPFTELDKGGVRA